MGLWNIKNNWVCLALLAVVVFSAFGNALFNGFVYDDHYLIKDNPFIRSFSNLPEVLTSDVTVVTPIAKPSGYYRPVSMFFLMLMYKIWGLHTFGLHLMSLLLHLANTFLVFLIIGRITSDRMTALATGLIFAVHPIHVEAVTPIFNYMGILASCFSLLSFWFFIESRKAGRGRDFSLSVLFCFLAMFSKEEAIVLPAVFVLCDLYFMANFHWEDLKERLPRYAWFALPVAACIFARYIMMQKAAAFGFWHLNLGFNILSDGGALAQIVTTVKIFAEYFRILLFPFRLSAFYLLPEPAALSRAEIFVAVAAVLGIFAFAFAGAKKYKLISFFIFFFFINSFMVSNIIPVGGLFAERFMYLPSVAFCFMVAYGLTAGARHLQRKNEKWGALSLLIALVVVVGVYGQATAARNYVWRNDVMLWSDTAQKTPQSSKPLHYLGDAYAYHGSAYYDQALTAYQEALQRPDAPEVALRNAMGTLYGLKGQQELALKEFERALHLDRQSPAGYYNIGITYYFQGEYSKALEYFAAGQRVDKNYFWLYYGIGLVLEKEGKRDEARAMFTKALALEPRFEAAKTALGK